MSLRVATSSTPSKVYGDWVPGQVSPSEKIIGEWFQSRRNRGQIVLAIKGAHYHLDAPLIKRLKPRRHRL